MPTTLKGKLLAMSVVSTGAALVAACVVLAAYDYRAFRSDLVTETQTYARMVAENSTAALSFGDANDAGQILSSLRVEPDVVAACIYDSAGKKLATFFRNGSCELPESASDVKFSEYQFRSNMLEVACPARLNNRKLGLVYVQLDLNQLSDRVHGYYFVFCMVLLGAMGLALALSRRFNRAIVGPVEHLSQTAVKISADRNYTVRAEKTSDDELGTLVDCFNAMLEQIEHRDGQLNLHRHHLEELVTARTAELSSAKDKAEESSRAKTAFLANMSHEIRTPMTAILGYSDLMLSPVQTMSDRINCLQVVRRNARHLMDLINDILDISKIEAEKMIVEKIPCDAARTVVEVVSMLRVRAVAKRLDLRIEFVGPIPETIKTDPLRFKQVLMNLTGNAIKFTETGQVTVRLSIEKCEQSSKVRVDVIDSGIGMSPEQINRLFQPFVQADESMTRKYGGTGLGLVISKRLARHMGGDLTVTSEQQRGSTFSLWVDGGSLEGLPMRENLTESMVSTLAQPVEIEEIVLKGRILLAEDGIDNQHLLTLHLTTAGAEVVVAPNGLEAVQLVRNERFDIVLMDMQMPEMDGYAATRELRKLGFSLPIIALTAHAMSGDRAKCIEAGCTDYLTKPIEREVLLRSVSGYLQKSEAQAAASGSGTNGKLGASAEPRPRPAGSAAVAAAMEHAVAGFVARLPTRVDSLISLIENKDVDELRRLVHQLKGSGAGFGFPSITELSARAESVIKATSNCDTIRVAIDELIELIRGVKGYDATKEANAKTETAHR